MRNEKWNAAVALSTFAMFGHLFEVGVLENGTQLWREAHLQVKMYQTFYVRTTFWSLEWENGTPLWREAHLQVKIYQTFYVRTTFWSLEWENGTPLWREAHLQVKMYKTHHVWTTFWSWDVRKCHAAVARSTFASQNVQNTLCSDHFLKFGCGKMVRRCGAKQICKSNCTKHTISGFWSLDVGKWHAPVARSTFLSQNVQNTACPDHCGEKHICKSKCAKPDHVWTNFWTWDVGKWYAAVARRAFAVSQNRLQ